MEQEGEDLRWAAQEMGDLSGREPWRPPRPTYLAWPAVLRNLYTLPLSLPPSLECLGPWHCWGCGSPPPPQQVAGVQGCLRKRRLSQAVRDPPSYALPYGFSSYPELIPQTGLVGES